MRPVVALSVENAASQDRCVDILRLDDNEFAYVECRRDPEDSHGWRRLGTPVAGFPTLNAAFGAARQAVGWIEAGR